MPARLDMLAWQILFVLVMLPVLDIAAESPQTKADAALWCALLGLGLWLPSRQGPPALVFVVLLAIGLGLAVVVYRKYVAYEPSVSRHVPAGATAVARFDLTHVMLYEPFRRAVFPLAVTVASPRSMSRDSLLCAR